MNATPPVVPVSIPAAATKAPPSEPAGGGPESKGFAGAMAAAAQPAGGPPADRKSTAQHATNPADGGALVPVHGNLQPQPQPQPQLQPPPVLSPVWSPITTAPPNAAPVQPAAASGHTTTLSAATFSTPAVSPKPQLPQLPQLPQSPPVGDAAAAISAAAPQNDAPTAASTQVGPGASPLDAVAAAGDAAAASLEAAAGAVSAAAATPNGALPSQSKANPPAATSALDATGAAGDAGSAAVGAAPAAPAAPILPVLARQSPGASDKQGHDGAINSSAQTPAAADASAVAGETNARNLATADSTAVSPTLPPAIATINSPQFPDQLAAHVSYMVDQNLNGATLQVNPPQLGPIELRVSVEAGHAQVWLSAHSAATCDALQSSSPKLREMLASQGFGQVSVDVSQRSFQDRSANAQGYTWTPPPDAAARGEVAAPIGAWSPRAAAGILDAYA